LQTIVGKSTKKRKRVLMIYTRTPNIKRTIKCNFYLI